MKNKRWTHRSTALTACVLALSTATACGAGQEPANLAAPVVATAETGPAMDRHVGGDVSFYESLRMEGAIPAFSYDSIAKGVRAADAVIIAEVVDVRRTRTIVGTEVAGDLVEMTGVVLRPVEVLAGSLPTEFQKELTVESIGGSPEDMKKIMPTGQAMWFLRHKGNPEPGVTVKPGRGTPPAGERLYYRLIAPEGLFVQGPKGVVAPVGEDTQNDMASQGTSATKLSDLATTVRGLKTAPR